MSQINSSRQYAHITGPILHALRAFDSAARLRSFTRAAEELCVTQGAVSQQIKILEDRLNLKLFFREARGLSLTTGGAKFAEVVSKALSDIDRSIAALTEDQIHHLTISCPPSFAMLWLMPRLGRFSRINPDIQLRVKAEYQEVDAGQMKLENVDLAIRYDSGRSNGVENIELMDEYLLPVASRKFSEANKLSDNPNVLGVVPLLHDASLWDGAPPFIEWCEWLEEASDKLGIDTAIVSGRRGNLFDLSQLALNAAVNDQGVAMGRSALVLDDIQKGRLSDVFQMPIRATPRYRLLLSETRTEDDAIDIFVSWLTEECQVFRHSRDIALGIS